ncbi:hypothetical protein [Aurantiacibacter odishensis]|uniref:hypothetical protein n=1 Tax=Aurantiacibacter odishensis TaxID=1155476 RepID=UPI0013C4C990|nr:hypothetical protein [Aurantiacibacter odishensis]
MAKISKPPVPAKLYKHFAAATIVLTAAIAMFADEDQRAAGEQADLEATAAEAKSGDVPAYGESRLARAEPRVEGSFGSEGGGFGAPMMSPGGEGGNRSSIAKRAVSTHRQPLPNMTPEEVAALSQKEYERLRALYVAAGAIEDVDRNAQNSEIEAASARRMGHGGSDS